MNSVTSLMQVETHLSGVRHVTVSKRKVFTSAARGDLTYKASWWCWHVAPVGVMAVTSSCVDQARCSCVNTEPGQAEAWPSAISVFLHTLTSGCLTSGSNHQPRDSVILRLSFCSHHSQLVLLLFDIFNGTDNTIRITLHI